MARVERRQRGRELLDVDRIAGVDEDHAVAEARGDVAAHEPLRDGRAVDRARVEAAGEAARVVRVGVREQPVPAAGERLREIKAVHHKAVEGCS